MEFPYSDITGHGGVAIAGQSAGVRTYLPVIVGLADSSGAFTRGFNRDVYRPIYRRGSKVQVTAREDDLADEIGHVW